MIERVAIFLGLLAMLVISGCTEKQATIEATNNQLSQYISINESASLVHTIGALTPDPGKQFLVMDMVIENHGYQEFVFNPLDFSVTVSGVEYKYDAVTNLLDSVGEAPLSIKQLLDGEKAEGSLVFQIPSGYSSYTLKYAGSGDYRFRYGDLLRTLSNPEKWLTGRTITFDLGDGFQTLELSSVNSPPGVSIKRTRIEATSGGYAEVVANISQSHINKDLLISNALKVEKINGFSTTELGNYDATLANGDAITVYLRDCPGAGGKFAICALAPDNFSLVTITSTLAKNRMIELLRTLKINATEEKKSSDYSDGIGGYSESSGDDVYVHGYYRKDGTYVRPHYRSAPRSG